jgi:hypothetical protein
LELTRELFPKSLGRVELASKRVQLVRINSLPSLSLQTREQGKVGEQGLMFFEELSQIGPINQGSLTVMK